MKHTRRMTLGAIALVCGMSGVGYPAHQREAQEPAYTSSIQVQDQSHQEHRQHREAHQEAAQLASLAKIDLAQATVAALAQVPGTVCKAALDSEHGNLVYSVEIHAGGHESKDVKVDAGNGTG